MELLCGYAGSIDRLDQPGHPFLCPQRRDIILAVYDPELVAGLRALQERYFAFSDELTAEQWDRRPFLLKVAQNTARLADALL